MVSRELKYRPSELQVCYGYDNDCYNHYPALDYQNEIIDIARILNSLGEEFRHDVSATGKSKDEAYFGVGDADYSGIHSAISSVDVLLEWLEHSGKRAMSDLKKREAVLRGILQLTDLGSQASIIGMLEFACKFLDVPDDPYPAQRKYIRSCLAAVEEQKERIFDIIEQAGDILKEMIDAEYLDITKGMQFDNALKEAHVEIESCRRRLEGAKKMITEMTQKMQALKWFSRAVRVVGLSISCYFFYHKYQASSISLPSMVVACLASLVLCFSLFPSRSYAFHVSLSSLDAKHRLLTERLDDIRERMKNSNDYKNEVIGVTSTMKPNN